MRDGRLSGRCAVMSPHDDGAHGPVAWARSPTTVSEPFSERLAAILGCIGVGVFDPPAVEGGEELGLGGLARGVVTAEAAARAPDDARGLFGGGADVAAPECDDEVV